MHSRFGLIPDVRRIAVLRANGIGDLIFALPALEALRRAYPFAEISLLASDWHRALLADRPGPVDKVIPVPPSRGVRVDTGRPQDAAEMSGFFEAMRRERFDVAVQLHGGGRYSNPFVLGLGARVTIGLKTPDAPPLDRWIPYVYFQSEIVRYVEVVGLCGAHLVTLDPHFAVTPRDIDESLAVAGGEHEPFAVIHPSASDPKRRWPADRFAALGRELRAAGVPVFVVGIERDRDITRGVVEGIGGDDRHDLTSKLSLGGLAGLLSRASLVVSNDSGPLHLAGAVGAPTVGIYWCGNVITAAPVNRERHRPVISWRLQCPRCGASAIDRPCGHTDSFVADVSIEEVRRAAFDLLGRGKDARQDLQVERRELVGGRA